MARKKRLRRMIDIFKDGVSNLKDRFISEDSGEVAEQVRPPASNGVAEEMVFKFDMVNVAKTVIVVLLLLLAAFFVYKVNQILLILFVAYLLSAALTPTVDWLHKYKLPRGLSVIVIYMLVMAALVVFLSSFLPILGKELVDVARNIQGFLVDIRTGDVAVPWLNFIIDPIQSYLAEVDLNVFFNDIQAYLSEIGERLSSLAGNAVSVLITFSNGVFNLLLVLVLGFYFIVERKLVHRFFMNLFPSRYENYIKVKNEALQVKIGYWLRGQLLLMVTIAAVTYVGLLLLGVEYALTLAVFAGIAELLPVVGPIVAFLVAVPIVANQSLWLIVFVAILFFIIQQLENNVIVPIIMKKAVGLSPIFVIVAMWIGGKFWGIPGLILSVPVASTVSIFLNDYINRDKR